MALEDLRPYWWLPCLLVVGYSLLGEGSRTAATAVIARVTPCGNSSRRRNAPRARQSSPAVNQSSL